MLNVFKALPITLIFSAVVSLPVKAETILAVISPHQTQDNALKDINLLRSWLFEQPKGDSIIVLNGWNSDSIATLTRPEKQQYQAKRTILIKNQEGFSNLKQFAKSRTTPKHTAGTLHIPKLMSVISQDYPQVKDIVLIGSASFDLPEVDDEAITKGQTYPADSNLMQSYFKGLFGINDVRDRLKGKRFHFLLSNTLKPYHYGQGVERFYHLYLHKQQGKLVTFSTDKSVVTKRLFNNAKPLPMKYKLRSDTSSQPLSSLFTRTPSVNPVVSAYKPVRVRLGIIWEGKVDLDIYGMLREDSIPVYYGNKTSRYATHHKDIMSGKHDQVSIYELITYQLPISICNLRIGINHYGGNASKKIKGTLRVEVGDALIAKEYQFSAGQGNQGGDMLSVLETGHSTIYSQRFLLRDVINIKGCRS